MNCFDGTIVIISLVELLFFSSGGSALGAFRSVRIFRTFRVLRVTKLLKSLAFMKVIIGVVSRSMQSFIYIALLLFLFIFSKIILNIKHYYNFIKINNFFKYMLYLVDKFMIINLI